MGDIIPTLQGSIPKMPPLVLPWHGCFSVGCCINRKESSLIPTLRSENLADISKCFTLMKTKLAFSWSFGKVFQSQSWYQRTHFSFYAEHTFPSSSTGPSFAPLFRSKTTRLKVMHNDIPRAGFTVLNSRTLPKAEGQACNNIMCNSTFL